MWRRNCPCDQAATETGQGGAATFDAASQPYLWATEFPWLALPKRWIDGRHVLTVAGSGELPLFFLAHGAARVAAVDISRPACFLNELKVATIKRFEWDSYLLFFLAGMSRAQGWLTRLGLNPSFSSNDRLALYADCRRYLQAEAKAFWDERILAGAGTGNPFEAWLRPTDFLCPNAIPLLRSAAEYETWRATAASYPLVQDAMDHFVDSSTERWDLIYCSNILEYVRQDQILQADPHADRHSLKQWYNRMDLHLHPGGLLCCYLFAAEGSDFTKDFAGSFEGLSQKGYQRRVFPVECRSEWFAGTRLRHTLMVFHKP